MSAVLIETHRPAVVDRTLEQCRIADIVAEFRRDIKHLGGVTDSQHSLAVGRLIAARCTDDAPLDLIERDRAGERTRSAGTEGTGMSTKVDNVYRIAP